MDEGLIGWVMDFHEQTGLSPKSLLRILGVWDMSKRMLGIGM